jgi:AraC-like DNA-binding protein
MPPENFQPSFHALAIINLIGASQALLSAAALTSTQRGNRLPNRYFAFFLTALSVYIIMAVLFETGYIIRVPYLLDIENPFLFMLGPCFYFYIRAAAGESLGRRGKILLHFLPALLFGLLWIAGLFISTEVKIVNYLNRLANPDKFDPVQLIALLIIDLQIFVYLIAGWRKLVNCAKRTESSVPNRVSQDWRWQRNVFIALFAVAVFSTILDVLSLDLANMRFTPFLLTIILCSLSYFGLRQSGLIPISEGEKAKKYAKSTLTPEASHEIFLKLQHEMEHEKLFADSTLSLPKLAKRLAVSTHHLSQIINERFGQNFFNYLSSVRIEEAKKRLSASDSDKVALSEIAYAVGFNSLSAFSTIFKKQSGISPSQFQKQQLSHASA